MASASRSVRMERAGLGEAGPDVPTAGCVTVPLDLPEHRTQHYSFQRGALCRAGVRRGRSFENPAVSSIPLPPGVHETPEDLLNTGDDE